MVLLSDQIQEFIDWLKEMTEFGDWNESIQIDVHKKLIECMISVPLHRFLPTGEGTCATCGQMNYVGSHLPERVSEGKVCGEIAPDTSGRSCDKPRGHHGDHWTYGGTSLSWDAARPVVEPREEPTHD